MNVNYHRFISGDKKNRAAGDFYVTPERAVTAFLNAEHIHGRVLDPACGNGVFARALRKNGNGVVSSDLYDRGFGRTGVDFLELDELPRGIATVMANPPYSIGLAFAQKALSLRPRKLCLLMRLTWLESGRRREFFQGTGLTRVWVHSTRINVSRNGEKYGRQSADGRGGMVPFAWFVWVRGHRGPPTIGWLP